MITNHARSICINFKRAPDKRQCMNSNWHARRAVMRGRHRRWKYYCVRFVRALSLTAFRKGNVAAKKQLARSLSRVGLGVHMKVVTTGSIRWLQN